MTANEFRTDEIVFTHSAVQLLKENSVAACDLLEAIVLLAELLSTLAIGRTKDPVILNLSSTLNTLAGIAADHADASRASISVVY